ncbi:tRNA (adenosine(37)-N6)-threonylcarbamoyltransferase complex ATPase subunit type 1 TsaE [Salinispira pacifica]
MGETLCSTADETTQVGASLSRALGPGSVVALRGPIGAGKTVFTRGLLHALGVREPITSPTYTIANEYQVVDPATGHLQTIYHIDLYRIESSFEFEMAGAEEMLYGDAICVIEWSERAGSLLPAGTIHVAISIEEGGSRRIDVRGN